MKRKETKFRLEQAFKRARLILESNKIKQKCYYDKNCLDFDLKIGDQVLLKNETGHKLEYKYTGPYTVIGIGDNDNIRISNINKKEQKVHKDRLNTIFTCGHT